MMGSYHLLESVRNLCMRGAAVNPLFSAILPGRLAQFPANGPGVAIEDANPVPPWRNIVSRA